MNITVTNFIKELKQKQPGEYNLVELQRFLHQTHQHYKRFKGREERETLNKVWNIMADFYMNKLRVTYPNVATIYEQNYLSDTYSQKAPD